MATSSMEKYISQLEGKVVVVTGAASGLGKQLSERLAEYKAQVLLVDINPGIKQVSDEINARLGEHQTATSYMVSDVRKANDIQAYFDKAVEVFGCIDVVVNNAGIANECSLFSQKDSVELDRIIDINLRAPMEATRIAVRYFRETGLNGVVLNTASIGGLTPISIMESYGTTKAGLIFFTTTCKGLAPQIRVNAVAPYFTNTPLVENNRMVSAYPIVGQIGLMNSDKVVKTMIRAICDESLAGDTLMI
ncbi:NAD(P)-binding protein, partial [Martensiomyces pterosporus]